MSRDTKPETENLKNLEAMLELGTEYSTTDGLIILAIQLAKINIALKRIENEMLFLRNP
jgi:hypothetical protein